MAKYMVHSSNGFEEGSAFFEIWLSFCKHKDYSPPPSTLTVPPSSLLHNPGSAPGFTYHHIHYQDRHDDKEESEDGVRDAFIEQIGKEEILFTFR